LNRALTIKTRAANRNAQQWVRCLEPHPRRYRR